MSESVWYAEARTMEGAPIERTFLGATDLTALMPTSAVVRACVPEPSRAVR